jgi:predicted acyl esterase
VGHWASADPIPYATNFDYYLYESRLLPTLVAPAGWAATGVAFVVVAGYLATTLRNKRIRRFGNTDTDRPGWLVIDPGGHPYAWYSPALAHDEAAALKRLERKARVRKNMLANGWTVRVGSGVELLPGSIDLVKASA